ncbi:hypothetical protein [Oceanobacillus oncorhynchi]|uniref:hypothetical protein n=1 Tax=Oceanobacillus oncorhynchi TaxID=545501 RepID=UPI001867E529|nr:hypothetical protein [Oceanobacillus oncorhynchi]
MKRWSTDEVKTIVIYVAMVLLVLLIIIGVIVGFINQNKEESEQQSSNEREFSQLDDVYNYDEEAENSLGDSAEGSNEPAPSDEELKLLQEDEIWEDLEEPNEEAELKEDVMFTEDGPKSYEEVLSEEEIKASQKVTEEFIEIVYNIDGEDPMKYYKQAENMMTDDLFERFEQEYKEGKMTWMYGLTREFESLEIYQPSSMDPEKEEGITWAARVQGTLHFHDRDEGKVTDVYIILLKEEEGKYFVDNLVINFPT